MSDFLDKYKLFSRAMLIWAVWAVTSVLGHYTGNPLGTANTADGIIVGAVVGLPTAAIAFIQWRGK